MIVHFIMENNSTLDDLQRMRMAYQIQELLKEAEDGINECFLEQEFEEFFDVILKLCDLFGDEVVVEGLSIAENGFVRIVKDKDEESVFPQVIEVRSGSFCNNSYYIYDNINYCSCHFFVNEVVNKNSAFLVGFIL